MGIRELQQILSDVRSGAVSVSEAEALIRRSGFADLGVAKIDTNRQSRRGFPETILCLNKTPDQVRAIFIELQKASRTVFATKASEEHWRALKDLSD